MAERINKGMKSAEEVERNARIVQEIESHIEGMEDVRTRVLHGVGLSFSPKCNYFFSLWVTPGWATYFLLWVLLSPSSLGLGWLLEVWEGDGVPVVSQGATGAGTKPTRVLTHKPPCPHSSRPRSAGSCARRWSWKW